MQRETDITIPPKALKAARKAYIKCPDLAWHDAVDAACLAMLRAWKTEKHSMIVGKALDEDGGIFPAILLPLPQETTND